MTILQLLDPALQPSCPPGAVAPEALTTSTCPTTPPAVLPSAG
jgi:hypothetical protein